MNVSGNSPSKHTSTESIMDSSRSCFSTFNDTENTPLDVQCALILEEAHQAFLQKKYEMASAKYSQVAEAYGQTYGALHPKCADVMFRYGRALLNHAIEKSGVFGDDEQVRNATGKREKDLLTVLDDTVTAELSLTHPPTHFHFDEANEDVDPSEEEQEPPEEDQDEVEDEPMEADDFEIAFEVLDVARVIYTSMLNGEMEKDLGDIPFEGKGKEKLDVDLILKQRLAEVISTLADVSLESESFTQAIEDYQKALLMKRDFLPPSDRRLAETHYKLALAIEYGNQSLDLALEHLKESRNVMVARQAELVGPQGQTERLEIDELILELDLKIEDLQNQLQVRQHPTSYSTFLPSETSSTPSTTMTSSSHSTTNVNDLSNLVKKKSHPSSSSSSSSSSSTVTKMTTGLTEETKRKRLLDEVEDQEEHDGMFNGSQPNEKEHLKHVRFK